MPHSFFQIRGVIEGFYGAFYTFPERNDLIRFIGEHGYNLYIYGPKNDRQHRHRWWESYPQTVMAQFAETVALANEAGVRFCYALSPITYDPAHDFTRLTAKLHGLYNCGVRDFSLLVDDIVCVAHGDPFCKLCPRPAALHIEVCNKVYAWLQSLSPDCTLNMCPSDYHGCAPFSAYLHELGAGLHPAIDVFYTGRDVCSSAISTADGASFADAIGRPPLIWDNYPVNDLAMRSNMHIGPIRERDATLHQAVRGIVVNPMLQAEASKIPLLTFADYFHDPNGYDPWRSWERALRSISGDAIYDALRLFGENSLESCLPLHRAPQLKTLTAATIAALERGEDPSNCEPLLALESYLNRLDDACYVLKHRMSNLRLRDNLLPWVEALDECVWVGKKSLRALRSLARGELPGHELRGLKRALEESKGLSKRVAGQSLLSLAEYAIARAEQRTQAGSQDEPPLFRLDHDAVTSMTTS